MRESTHANFAWKTWQGPEWPVRNFIANKELGTQSDIHENVLSPGVVLLGIFT